MFPLLIHRPVCFLKIVFFYCGTGRSFCIENRTILFTKPLLTSSGMTKKNTSDTQFLHQLNKSKHLKKTPLTHSVTLPVKIQVILKMCIHTNTQPNTELLTQVWAQLTCCLPGHKYKDKNAALRIELQLQKLQQGSCCNTSLQKLHY